MFRFADPNFLYLLILLPFLVALYLYSNYHRRQNIRKYGDPALLKGLMPTISKYRPDIKFWLTFAALTLVILMLARPQFGSKMETVKRSGVEAVIALDISNSMLAEDVTPSRLDKSKKLISRLVDTFNNDKVGLIVFAGDAFTQLPITSDYVSAKMFLETINPSLITTQGTDIGAAIRLAMKSFTPQEGVGRAIIVITDVLFSVYDRHRAAGHLVQKGIPGTACAGWKKGVSYPRRVSVGTSIYLSDLRYRWKETSGCSGL